jgi:hypothetical protein
MELLNIPVAMSSRNLSGFPIKVKKEPVLAGEIEVLKIELKIVRFIIE